MNAWINLFDGLQDAAANQNYWKMLALLVLMLMGYVAWALTRLNKARNALQRSLADLEFQKFAFDQHSIVSMTDGNGRITYTNGKFSKVSQYSQAELLGQDHRLLNSGYHPSEFFKEMWRTISQGRVWHGEVRNRRKDGSFYWVDSTIVPFMDSKGKPSRYVSIRTDITERKTIELKMMEQRKFYERISETLGEGLYVQDAEGFCIYMNSEAEKLLGWSRIEFIGKPVHETIHTQTAEGQPLSIEDCPISKTTRTGQRMKSEDQVFVRKDGSVFAVTVVSQGVFKNGQYQGAVVSFQDISHRKQAEAEMKAAKEAAEEANRAKGDFLANMSHEIRTPINGIIGMTALALDTDLNPEQKEYIHLVKSSADALLDIINDILDFSKIEAGKMELEQVEFNLQAMLSETTRSIALRAHQKDLELLLDIDSNIPDTLIGDPARLRQIIINLLSNAIKFTEHGEIMVKASLESIQKDEVKLNISVRDTGIGIPKEKFHAIFESFSQADSTTTRKYGGTGLGLTISSRLVSLMKGHIWLESEINQGTTFFIEIPFARTECETPVQDESERLKNMRALIVDDNATHRMLTTELLQRYGMQAETASNGRQAEEAIERAHRSEAPYQFLLLDASMPDMDGFAIVQQMREQTGSPAIPIMMITPEGQRNTVARCRELSISYLLKPFTQSDLFDAIMKSLGHADPSSPSQNTPSSLQQNKVKLHILLAEDNSINQTVATRLLQKFGHSVEVAENGVVAVEKWQTGCYDLILMDVDMPKMNGYDATIQIRNGEKSSGAHIPIIGLTAHVLQGSREECLSKGMDGYISKPINTEALWKELDSIQKSGASLDEQAPIEKPQPAASHDFNIHKALAIVDNDLDLFREMVGFYVSDYPTHLDHLKQAIETGDSAQISHQAHSLKGMLSLFYFPSLGQVAERIEKHQSSDYDKDYAELKQGLDWLASELQKACER